MWFQIGRNEEAGTRAFSFLASPFHLLVRVGQYLSSAAILLCFAIILFAIVRRYLLGQPLQWSDEFNGYLVVAMVMLGIAATFRINGHIGVDLLTTRLDPAKRKLFEVASNVAVLAFAVIFTSSAIDTVVFSYDFGNYSTDYMEIQLWIVQAPMVAGGAMLALTAALNILERILGVNGE